MNAHSAARTTGAATSAARGPGFGLVLMLCAQFMVMLDASIVTVAIPEIQHELGFSATTVQSVITAYNTAFGGALILCGRVGDLLGRRRVFVIGMVAFAVTSLLCGLAQDAVTLVIGRVLQGFSAALIAPTALALLTTSVPEGPARAKAMSKFGMATVVGFISGLVFSGLLVEAWGWQGVFYATVPVGVLVAVLAPRFIPDVPRQPHRIDVLGAILITLGVALLVAAPAQSVSSGPTSGAFLWPLAAGVALLGAFLWLESRHPEPLVRLGLFRSPVVRAANLVSVASGISSGSAYLLVTMYLQEVLGYSALQAGLIVAPVGVLNISFGFVLGRLITRLGLRVSVTAATVGSGLLIALVASQVSPETNIWVYAIALLPMGMAFMATTVTSTLAATSNVANHEQGLAAGVRQTSFQLGIAVGVAILIPIASSAGAGPVALADGIRTALFLLAAIVVVVGVVAFAGLRSLARKG
ncbi:MFS transporter [Actinokineospora sp. UTMC 2448]|uniref:MFS transporter n=1 Tax=Actinokineospora sp. UTMC 2448 TaxID=2268449 RepID=UPI00216477B4|nr:MFS transporter [Actinokineospora sp. UTMC 2448]UVS81451.1 Efflux protein A [Actinokineospora sp. UTMC 2448]